MFANVYYMHFVDMWVNLHSTFIPVVTKIVWQSFLYSIQLKKQAVVDSTCNFSERNAIQISKFLTILIDTRVTVLKETKLGDPKTLLLIEKILIKK